MAEQGKLPGTPRRVAALIERWPGLAEARTNRRLAEYYMTYHGSSDLAIVDSQGGEVPAASTILRAWQRATKRGDGP